MSEEPPEGATPPAEAAVADAVVADAAVADAAVAAGDAAPRDSHLSIEVEPVRFPDDDAMCKALRRFDHGLGVAEQAFVFGLLALVVCVAAIAAVHDKIAAEHIGRWWHYIVRGGTFSVAMFAAVFATQQERHLAMDLVSRRLSPRGRLVLGLVLKALTVAVAVFLFTGGRANAENAGGTESLDLFGLHIVDSDIVATIYLGAALIILHSLLHFAIDASYLARGKVPPERMRSGH